MSKLIVLTGNKIVTFLLVLIGCYALRSPRLSRRIEFRLSSTTENTQNDVIEELISSNELQNVFALLLKNPTISPSPQQSTLLLNNLDILAKISKGNEISKFYTKLQKGGKAIPSYGSMAVDGPLSELSLPKFETLMTVDPTFLQAASEMKQSTYESLLIPNELGVMSSASRRSLEIRVKLQIALLFGFLDFGSQLVATGDSHTALVNVALTFAIAAGLAVLESPLLLNGEIGRRIGWMKLTVGRMLSAEEKKKDYRSNAATFLVAYMLGTPMQNFDLDTTSPTAVKRYRYPDAPRIDLMDPAMSVLEQTGQIDLVAIKRLATVHMTSCAIKAIDGVSIPKIAEYSKILLAALAQRSASPLFSTITHEDFPTRLLPTLARWGFVESAMIIRENAVAMEALVGVFENGGGVGDAIAAIESAVASAPDSPLAIRRNRRLKLEAEATLKEFSTFNAIEAVNNAKLLSTPAAEALDLEPMELIPGTSRIHTRSELVLPTNPSPSQVKILARDIMNNKLQADKISYGKVSERTKKEIAALYERVSIALRIYEITEEARMGNEKDFESTPIVKGEEHLSDTLRESREYMRNMIALEEREGLLQQVGLSQEKLAPLNVLPPIMRDLDLIGETLIQLNKLKESYWSNYYNIEALWVFRGSIYFERFTGLAAMNAVDSVWDATGLSTRIPKGLAKEVSKSMGSSKLNKDTVKELNELVERIAYQPPSGDGSNSVTTSNTNVKGASVVRGEELKGVRMIPVENDEVLLLSRDTVNRSHEQRRKALIASRTLPLLADLMPAQDDDTAQIDATDDIIAEQEDSVPVSPVNMMIRGNIGASYRHLEDTIERLEAQDVLKAERIKELQDKLRL